MRHSRARTPLVGAVALLTALGLAASGNPAVAAPADAAVSAAPVTGSPDAVQSVIVVLKDQLKATPAAMSGAAARQLAGASAQSAVLNRLTGRAPTAVQHFTLVNSFAASVTAAQAAALAADPAVASVTPNRLVSIAPPAAPTTPTPTASVRSQLAEPTPAAATATQVPATACSTNPNKPQLEPEALQSINARSDDPTAKTAASLGIDGTGVTVGFIADGINPDNAGFLRKNHTSSIVDYQDFYGDGPDAPASGAEAFGDASSISAQGNVTYDVANFANPGVVAYPGGHCYIRIVGVAPGANVVALKAGSELLPSSAVLQAIDYAVTVAHVDVLNESFGGDVVPDSSSRNTIQQFNDQAVGAGVTVTVSTGDAGVTSTIGNPSTDPNVISTGAFTDSRLYEQTGYALAPQFSNGTWHDKNISSLSSAGITDEGTTIDLSAPGEADWAVCDDGGNFSGCTSFQGTYSPIEAFGGTSQSAPMTAGVAALVIQAYRKAHGGTSPSPALVKQLIVSTTHDLDLPGQEQGSGALDARAAVEAALTYPGASAAPAGLASNIALSANQLSLVGSPGSTLSGQVTVTNVGTGNLTVLPSTRSEALLSRDTQTVAISASDPQTTPYPTTGAPWVYKKITFAVPSGADRLNAAIIWQSGAGPNEVGPVVRMSLFNPSGTYEANTRPQGGPAPANYGNVDVRSPQAGTWTAVLYTVASPAGFTGNVSLQTDAERNLPVGAVTPGVFSLAPGASRAVTVQVPLPATSGDMVDTLSIASSNGHVTAVPLVLRAKIQTPGGHGTFAGTITGGNGRGTPAQQLSYNLTVPPGQRDLDVALTLPTDPNDTVETALVDPNGEVPSIESNQNADGSGDLTSTSLNVVANPIPGKWRYVVVVLNPVTGAEFQQDVTGTVAFNQQQVSVIQGLQGNQVPRGATRTVKLRFHNNGPVPLAVQTDARTSQLQTVQLSPQFASSTVPLPLSVDDLSDLPGFLVPPDTQQLSLSAASTTPAQVELNSSDGGIDVLGDLQEAQDGSTISTATVGETAPAHVAQGFWGTFVQQIGPFTDAGAPAGASTLVANVTTAKFDTNVVSSTGDFYALSTDAAADPGNPVLVAPGASAMITLKVTGNGRRGSHVNGVLHFTTPPSAIGGLVQATGDILLSVPYSYTIK